MPAMKSKFKLVIVLAIFVLTCVSTRAVEPVCDWQEGDPNKMHWPQLPDLTTIGVSVDMFHAPLADDFLCTESGPIKDIHIWGSFADDILPDAGPGSLIFKLSIYSNIPPASGAEPSRPGELLWSKIFHPEEYTFKNVSEPNVGSWYDPLTNVFKPSNHLKVFQYNFCIEDEYFIQEQDKIYWLEVRDLPRNNIRDYTFGWKSTTIWPDDLRWNDDAVWLNPSPSSSSLSWLPLKYPVNHHFQGESLDFAFVITGEPLCPPLNDDCENAISVGDVSNLPFDTTCATFDGPGHCMRSPNIWYCYTATCTGCATVSLCGSKYDTKLAVYNGCDCSLSEGDMIACNDDYCGWQSQISFHVETGNKYLIEIGGYKDQTGQGVITISCDEWCPPNDDCCDAEPVGNVTNMPFNSRCSTFDGPGHCMDGPNIWYCYKATCTGQATVSLCGSEYDTILAVYNGCGCYPIEDDLIACNDDFCGRQSEVSFDSIAGQEYLIEIGGYNGQSGRGVMTISCEGLPGGLDFGDAPDGPSGSGYPTLLANNGARHVISGPWLGDSSDKPDYENNGQPDNNAFGDDNDGNDDEDGVYIPPLVQGQNSVINVHVNGGGGIVQAWLDFNSDLAWQASELIYNGFLPNGIHTIPITVPVGAAPGWTFARFRISSEGGLSIEGPACDGEVEDHKVLIKSMLPSIKWFQWPDLTQNGINIRVDSSDHKLRTIADDFECTRGGRITDVHLWGSWKNDIKGRIKNIHLSIHNDDPAGYKGYDQQNLFSQPDPEVLWERDFGPDEFDEALYTILPEPGEWWWDPATCKLIAGGDREVWRIDILIDPDEAFIQKGAPYNAIIYWLGVRIETECGQFGWKTRHWPEHYMDDAVWDVGSELPRIWKELRYPPGHPYHGLEKDSIDMAFIITGEEEPVPPKPPIEHVKWSQPPIEQDLISARPIYCGWDEPSYAIMFINELEGFWRVVADDFRCIGQMPITSIHWWGSYTCWDCPEPPETKPIAWRIGFWSNVPAGSCGLDYSRPRELLWMIDISAERVSESMVGFDSFPDEPSDTCFQYNVKLEPSEYFWQSEYLDVTEDDVYWISVTAVYPALLPQSFYPWGWKTRPWSWMDDAVTFEIESDDVSSASPSNVVPIENDLICGQPQSYDMSFELDTDPNYIKWEQPFTGIRNWQHYEDEKSMATEEATAMKWVQLPDLDEPSMVVDATNDMPPTCSPQILADDFLCDASGRITEIQIWGSWWCDILPSGDPCNAKFRLYIYRDIPAQCQCVSDYSKPGQLLWRQEFGPGDFTVELFNENIPEGYYNPCNDSFMSLNHYKVYKYKFYIDPNCAFNQQGSPDSPTIYWLGVQAQLVHSPGASATRFGWKVSQQHWNDKAVWAEGKEPSFEPWKELKHPQTCEPIDLAFTITTETKGLQYQRVVADDWKCRARTPVTAITWWGSYIGYRYQACECQQQSPPVRPDYFMLSIWKDVPDPDPDDPTNYSHPGTKIWEYKADIYDEVLVGYDKHPEPLMVPQDGYEPVFRYSVRLPQDKWFCQKDVNDIYWLSVVAVYEDPSVSIYPWGWTNHKCTAWEPEGLVEVAHWMFDETAGIIAADSSNNGNHCMLIGETKWQTCCGRICGAIDLDGDGDYVKRDTTEGLNFAPNSFSVCAWINARVVTDGWKTIIEYDRGGHNWFGIWLNKDGKFHFRVGGNTHNSVQILNPDKWYFLTGTYDATSGTMSMYINGQFDSSGMHSSGFDLPVNSKVTIGARGWEDGEYFNGLIDDVRVYDRVLSANEIKELANMGVNYDAVAGYLDTSGAEPEWEWMELRDQTGMSEDMSFVLFTTICEESADYNNDGIVNFTDYVYFVDDWLWSGPACGDNHSDLNCDGIVDFKDLRIFVLQWLFSCP